MSKEMIVSVNGREKKIAVIENGQVTEFYIERGEATAQGIVGNIYKGRVMRVLPGMQSAFVDIGLERDAFLYVSDFFDEEEEFERIVIEKIKPETIVTPPRAALPPAPIGDQHAARQSADALPVARDQRLQQRPEVQPQNLSEENVIAARISELAPEVSDEVNVANVTGEGGSRRRRRRRGRGGAADAREEFPASRVASDAANSADAKTDEEMPHDDMSHGVPTLPTYAADLDDVSPFAATLRGMTSDFERVVDEDGLAEQGEMLKDAILQERLFDQIRAGEFNIEATPSIEVGAFLSAAPSLSEIASSFQRIDDSDYESVAPRARALGAAHISEARAINSSFLDEGVEESESTNGAFFERVSDEDSVAENIGTTGITEATDSSATARRKRSTGRAPKAKQAMGEAVSTRGGKTASEEDEATKETAQKKAASSRSRAASTERAPSQKKAVSNAASRSRTKRTTTKNAAEDAEKTSGDVLTDATASVTARGTRGEFSTRRRRGGANRRRPNNSQSEAAPTTAVEEPDNADAAPMLEAEIEETRNDFPPAAIQPPLPALAPPNGGQGNGRQHAAPANGGRRERRERHAPPMITDLLREGQEIIVQIAKEPISQKGARITSHIALPGRFLVYMPTIEHVGVSRKIESDSERVRLRKMIQTVRAEEDVPSGGFIVRTAGTGITETDLREDARYLVRTWRDIRRAAEKQKAPALAHRDLDLVQRLLRDQLSDEFTAIRVDSEEEYLRIAEFVNRIQPRLVSRVKLYTRDEPILDAFGVQAEIDKAIKPRVWLRSGGYLVINQTEALVAIDVNTGKFVGRGGSRLEDTITKTNLEAVDEIARQIRLRDLGGIIVLDLIDMEDRRNRQRVLQSLHEALENDKSPTKVLSFNDFGLVIMTRKRVKQSLERTLCAPCSYCQGAGLVKSASTVCYEILEEARRLARGLDGESVKGTTLRVNPEVTRALRSSERDVLTEIEDYLGTIDITSDEHVHQEQFDFAFV